MDKTSYGATFRELRQGKMITLKDIEAQTGITSSFISRFERGQSAISVDKLVALVNAINLSINDFFDQFYLNEALLRGANATTVATLPLPFLSPIAAIIGSEANRDVITQAKKQALSTYRNNPTRNNHFLYLIFDLIDTLADDNARAAVPDALIAKSRIVVRYLYQVDQWGQYEILLFEIFSVVISNEDNLRLLRLAIKTLSGELRTKTERHHGFTLLLADFTAQLAVQNYALSKQVLAEMDHYRMTSATDAITRLFCRGWYAIATGDTQNGQQTCQHALAILNEIGLIKTDNARELQYIFENIRKDPSFAYMTAHL